jgi:DNA-binding transcriptional LysR family regulator
MSRAAAELHTVQSNVTARIRVLEEELKTPLFDRHSSGVTLTDAGRRLLPYAVQMQRLLEDSHRAVAEDGMPKGSLVIGSLETTAALRLSPLLADYVAAYPEVDLVLRTGTSAELVQDVLARRLEGAFVCGPVDHPELESRLIVREELVVLTAPSLTSLDAVLQRPDLKLIVLRAGCSYRQRLEDLLVKRGIVGLRWLEFGTIEAIISCVAAGLGITLLPKALIGAVWREGRVAIHSLPASESAVETVFVRRLDGFVSSALAAFLMRASGSVIRSEAAE